MMTAEESANVAQLMEDLETDLRNGNIPTSKLLIVSIVNCLILKHPLEWKMLGDFLTDNLEDIQLRVGLMHQLPKLKELICPFQPDQEAVS